MTRQGMRSALIVLLALEIQTAAFAQPQPQRPGARTPTTTSREAFFTGTVVEIYDPRLFSLRPIEGGARELLVLAPRALSTVQGAMVAVSGSVRRFGAPDLSHVRGWSDLDERLRARFAGRPVVVATAVMSTTESPGSETEQPSAPEAKPQPEARPSPAPAAPLPVRATTLVAFIDSIAGQQVRVQDARVVGLITPGVFLVEPATRYLKSMGERDRVAVFIDPAHLRVAPELLVGSVVGLEGFARTVLSIQATSEVQWPSRLRPEVIDRLEIRAAILATSVHTAEGTELTDRPRR